MPCKLKHASLGCTPPRPHLDSARLHNTHMVVYNSKHRHAGSPLSPSPQLSLFEGDISTDLVYGYLLCTRHAQEDMAAHH